MSTPASLASFDQGLAGTPEKFLSWMLSAKPMYEQWEKSRQSQTQNFLNSLASSYPQQNLSFPDLTPYLDKAAGYYDKFGQEATTLADQRSQNVAGLVADALEKKARRQGLGNQGTMSMTGPESAWRAEYGKSVADVNNTNRANIASNVAMGKAGLYGNQQMMNALNEMWKNNQQNAYNTSLWKYGLANQYANNARNDNPFLNLGSLYSSMSRGGGGANMMGMSGYGGGSGTNVDLRSADQIAMEEAKNKQQPIYNFFPSDEELKKQQQQVR